MRASGSFSIMSAMISTNSSLTSGLNRRGCHGVSSRCRRALLAGVPPGNGTFPVTAVNPPSGITYTNALGADESFDGDSYSVAGIATEVPAAGMEIGDNYNNRFRAHMYAGDDGSYFMYGLNQDGDYELAVFTELEETAVEDTDSGCGAAAHTASITPHSWIMHMLDGAVIPAPIYCYPAFPIQDETTDIDTDCFCRRIGWRLANGNPGGTPLIKANVYLGNTAVVGACRRGRLPHIRFGNVYFQDRRPLDAAGNWLHWDQGVMYPRNGPYDQLPLKPDAS